MTETISSISQLPNRPAVYAMYGGRGRGLHVAYVGVAGKLKSRIAQHLIRRDSSVATGTSAVVLNPDYVTQVRWWEHPRFAERHALEAAELVAFDLLNPALRSRGVASEQARKLYDDESFREEMQVLFSEPPICRLVIPTLQDALERIRRLEQRLAFLEKRVAESENVD